MDDCDLCNAVIDSRSENHKLENSPIFETDNFVVLPCVGPLVTGHLLAISKNHYLSLGQMGDEGRREYDGLALELRRFVPDLLEAEHGSSESDCGGACVVHAHVHLLPGHSRFLNVFDGVFDEIPPRPLPDGSPYLFLRSSSRASRAFSTASLPSQMLRQTICSIEGTENWDWRKLPRDHLLLESIAFWKTRREKNV